MACLVAFSLEAELGLGGVFLFQEPEVMSTQVGGDRDGTWYMWLNGGEVRDSDRLAISSVFISNVAKGLELSECLILESLCCFLQTRG